MNDPRDLSREQIGRIMALVFSTDTTATTVCDGDVRCLLGALIAALDRADQDLDLLLDCWNQFAYSGKDGALGDGGLSTLEALRDRLAKHLNPDGSVIWPARKPAP